MADKTSKRNEPMPGSARLNVVLLAAVAGYMYVSMLEYALPLFLDAANESGVAKYEKDAWATLMKFQIIAFAVAPLLAGVLSRRYGERKVWCVALLGKVIIAPLLALHPPIDVLKGLAVWQGMTTALIWTAGLSLSQMVPPEKRGRASTVMLMGLGIGSLIGPIFGRFLVHRDELSTLAMQGDALELVRRLFNFAPFNKPPSVQNFHDIFYVLAATTLVSSFAIGRWAQYAGQFESGQMAPSWDRVLQDLRSLVLNQKFWTIVVCLSILCAPCLHASNQYLPFRAEVLGLKKGSSDTGWIWMNLLKTIMWLPGGMAVGWIAGRRCSGTVGAVIACAFAAATVACGISRTAAELFAAVALFEFLRQFMRWLFTGYLSEHLPSELRSTAIGLSVTCAGFSSTVYAWLADWYWNARRIPQPFAYDSPFFSAAVVGLLGAVALAVYDRIRPIREQHSPGQFTT